MLVLLWCSSMTRSDGNIRSKMCPEQTCAVTSRQTDPQNPAFIRSEASAGGEGAHLKQDTTSMPLNLWGWLCFHGALKDQLPWSQANHRAGTPGPNNIRRGCG